MNAIWKFPLTAEETEIEAPIEHFLTVQMQGDTPCVWAIVNPDKTPRKYKVVIIGTGWECQRIDASKYIWDNIPTYKSVKEPAFAMFSSRNLKQERSASS